MFAASSASSLCKCHVVFEMFAATGNPLFKGRKDPAANVNAFPVTTDTKLFGHVVSEGEISNASASLVPEPPKPQGEPGISALYRLFYGG